MSPPLADMMSDTEGVPVDVIDDHATAVLQVPEDGPRELVRIGRPVELRRNDNGRWEVAPWGFVFKDVWERLEEFQDPMPPLPPNFPVHIIAEGMRETTKWNEVPYAAEVERRMNLNPKRSVRWEIDFLHSDRTWSVDTAVMGARRHSKWTWGDIHFTAPVLRVFGAIANFFGPLVSRKIYVPTS